MYGTNLIDMSRQHKRVLPYLVEEALAAIERRGLPFSPPPRPSERLQA